MRGGGEVARAELGFISDLFEMRFGGLIDRLD